MDSLRKKIAVLFSAACLLWASGVGAITANGAGSFQVGDQGGEIAEIQAELSRLGYDVVPDGDFGPATVEAVRDFQVLHGMEPDGTVGPETYAALLGRSMPEVSRGSNYYARRIVQTAMQYIGVPYVFGGTSPSGFDCSGYVQFVFANAGVALPRTADVQYEVGRPVATSELRAGDLVFFSTYEPGPSHVGIYLEGGNFINATSSRGIAIDSLSNSYWGARYIGARRVI